MNVKAVLGRDFRVNKVTVNKSAVAGRNKVAELLVQIGNSCVLQRGGKAQ